MNADPHTLAGAFALDALTDVEREQFEIHLRSCPDCQSEVASLREPATRLASTVETDPPPELRTSVLSAISGVRPLPPITDDSAESSRRTPGDGAPVASAVGLDAKRRARTRQVLAVVAAAVVAIGVVIWSPWSQPDESSPQRTVAEQVMDAEDAQMFTADVDGMQFTVVRSASMGMAVLRTEDLPAAPNGHHYQAWYMVDGDMVRAGVMPTPAEGSSETMLSGDPMDATAIAISVEPDGGSGAPSSATIAEIPLG